MDGSTSIKACHEIVFGRHKLFSVCYIFEVEIIRKAELRRAIFSVSSKLALLLMEIPPAEKFPLYILYRYCLSALWSSEACFLLFYFSMNIARALRT